MISENLALIELLTEKIFKKKYQRGTIRTLQSMQRKIRYT